MKKRVEKYIKPNIAENIKDVSSRIKKNMPPVKRTSSTKKNVKISNTHYNKNNNSTKNVNLIQELKKTNTKKVFIVGGGPSLKNFDFNNLKGLDTIAVNKSIEYIQNPTYFVTMDYTFLKKSKLSVKDINAKTKESFFILNSTHNYIKRVNGVFTDVRIGLKYSKLSEFNNVINSSAVYRPDTGFGNTLSSFAHGDNSGYCAIQLALLLGYEEIYLLGFDMCISGKNTHFHSEYRIHPSKFKSSVNNYKANLIKSIQISKTDKIISCTPSSSLNNFIKYVDFYKSLKHNNNTNNNNTNNNNTNNDNITKNMAGDLRKLMIVGYYTINTGYEAEAKKLISSLNKLNLNHDIVGVPNLGDWQANTRFKAKFMLEQLDKHKGMNLLYVDSDAIVHSRPTLFTNYNCDIAVRWQDFRWRKNECLSGTIFMANNEITRKLCKKWMNINNSEGKNAKTFEQWNLGSAIKEMKRTDGLRSKNLPPEYTFIFDSMRRMYPNVKPVIEHFQASRRLRNKVNKK